MYICIFTKKYPRTWMNERMRFSPIPFHWWKSPVAGPGMEEHWRVRALSDRDLLFQKGSRTPNPGVSAGDPGARPGPLGWGESHFEKTGGGGLMQKACWTWCWCWTWHPDIVTRFSVQYTSCGDLPGGSEVENLAAMQEAQRWEDPLEEGMTTHSSTLVWRVPWTEEPGRQ